MHTPDPSCPAAGHDATPYWYRRGCRCTPTRRAWSAYQKDYKQRRAAPGYRERQFREQERRDKLARNTAIVRAEVAGTARTRSKELNRSLAIGAHRKFRAMMRIGHPLSDICEATHVSPARAARLIRDTDIGGMWPNVAARIDVVYREWSTRQGRCPETAITARNRNYLPPAAWAYADLDNPDAVPTWPHRKVTDSQQDESRHQAS